MGCAQPVSVYERDKFCERYRQDFEALRLQEPHLGQIHAVFHRLASNPQKLLSVQDIYCYVFDNPCNPIITPFMRRVFRSDLVSSIHWKYIDFRLFVFCLWDICTLQEEYLPHYAFHFYDVDNKGIIKFEAFNYLEEMYGVEYNKKGRECGIRVYDQTKDKRELDLSYFCQLCDDNRAMVAPIEYLRDMLRETVCGAKMWEIYEDIRDRLFLGRFLLSSTIVRYGGNVETINTAQYIYRIDRKKQKVLIQERKLGNKDKKKIIPVRQDSMFRTLFGESVEVLKQRSRELGSLIARNLVEEEKPKKGKSKYDVLAPKKKKKLLIREGSYLTQAIRLRRAERRLKAKEAKQIEVKGKR
mmetsp:Transcript_15401/g.23214  ORF Transcript_15401/g.23214 Transcript_15401/m.23214 type:complete len:356 (+) Transcript_15401:131-1198(+)|eukprot:CAMPEP_0185031696 /NCGR_PEP_ID=MMETSP1103-20130426/19311_1 /TAXON_ID=36769 /ORGANISM="Paraphysomonas bandaiensis, Strain Caron Lab Isolate" /LENGTH=355 /DNA_ID=CAMNT_0027567309 /DNA_START=103 /DNA_END=1173 /DNA_ORIENTATION=-